MNITALATTEAFARLAAKVVAGPNGCHNWTGGKTTHGYGKIHFQRCSWLTHRLVMTLIHGQIAPGMEVHHRCFNRSCINPRHLELLTHAANSQIRNPETLVKSSTGVLGVYFVKDSGKYKVSLRANMMLHHGGIFSSLEDAIVARDELRDRLSATRHE